VSGSGSVLRSLRVTSQNVSPSRGEGPDTWKRQLLTGAERLVHPTPTLTQREPCGGGEFAVRAGRTARAMPILWSARAGSVGPAPRSRVHRRQPHPACAEKVYGWVIYAADVPCPAAVGRAIRAC